MQHIIAEALPQLRRPVLIAAFAGWNDAATVATSAVRFLAHHWSATKCAHLDPEEFFVFTETRPEVRIVQGAQREIEWPSNTFYYYQAERLTRDFLLLLGIEPQLRWKAFTREIVDFCLLSGVRMVVTLGGLLADVLHSAPVALTGSSSDPEMAARLSRLGLRASAYQGPTGIVGVLGTACREVGITTASIWGSVPHYISAMPNPKVSAAMLGKLDAFLDLNLDLHGWHVAAAKFEKQVSEAVTANPEVAEYVRKLEERERERASELEPEEAPSSSEFPSGEAVVRDLEEFLRRRQHKSEDDSPE